MTHYEATHHIGLVYQVLYCFMIEGELIVGVIDELID